MDDLANSFGVKGLEGLSDSALLGMALFLMGMFLKRTPRLQDWMIPYVMGALGVLGYVGLMKWVWSPRNLMLGFIAGALAVFGHQLVKQASDGRMRDRENGKQQAGRKPKPGERVRRREFGGK